MEEKTIGFALSGSFCTFNKAIEQIEGLKYNGYKVMPIMSENAYSMDTRFGNAADFIKQIEDICETKIMSTIVGVEPVGPEKLLDAMIIEPCTGNTLAKLSMGMADTAVTMAAKAHLRNSKPLIIAVSTNDGLGSAAKNIGNLMNYKNIYFVPMKQDDYKGKPRSVVADFDQTLKTIELALLNEQIQPIYY